MWLHMHLEVVLFREQKWILEVNNQYVLGYPAMGLAIVQIHISIFYNKKILKAVVSVILY